ncbi:hypothetical protein [Streptomyces sp. CB03238]|uniref:hypothetical protein n=1 Tax=Streptomyces sp. CB03238 TaxID=1907777 RepID=UPI000A1104E1|nr:hypothetical protein [Streptomyces sp. CB03238]ORT60910.1 hypothetical protein BKD26_06845 [Streptomyces sp. CB03238]
MGASAWDYVTAYEGGVEESLHALQTRVFKESYGPGTAYRTLKQLRADHEFMGHEGTHSILDIDRVVHTADAPDPHNPRDYGTLRPLAADRVLHHFGTDRPTVRQYEESVAAAVRMPHQEYVRSLPGECRMRWTGLYVLLHTGDEPTHVGIFGFSGD